MLSSRAHCHKLPRLPTDMLLLAAAALLASTLCEGGRPRVYNALITSNQELVPSRAYPAVLGSHHVYFPHHQAAAPHQGYDAHQLVAYDPAPGFRETDHQRGFDGGYNHQELNYKHQDMGYNQEDGYKQQELPYKQQEVPYKQHELPYKQQELPYKQQEVPYKQHELPYKQQELPYKQQEVPYKQHELPYKQQELPYKQQQVSYKQQELLYKQQQQQQQVNYKQEEGGYKKRVIPHEHQVDEDYEEAIEIPSLGQEHQFQPTTSRGAVGIHHEDHRRPHHQESSGLHGRPTGRVSSREGRREEERPAVSQPLSSPPNLANSLPLNNKPANIPVVPPPPIPIRQPK